MTDLIRTPDDIARDLAERLAKRSPEPERQKRTLTRQQRRARIRTEKEVQ
tara:strand:- start:40 stop:189 length:150 start_codon:yes stop_codon:yes gene_type:complete